MCDTEGNDFIQAKKNESGMVGKSIFYMTVDLRDVIDVIENVDTLDGFQLAMEISVSMLAVFGNILTVIVLWEVSFTHPAQALRLALAVTDFFTGISHCFLAVCDHSYFIWCAENTAKCDYEVNVVLFSNRLEIIRKGYSLMAAIIFMITFTVSFAYLVVSALDRFVAIFRPLSYKSIVTMKRVRIQIIFWISISIAYTFGMITRGDHTSWKSSYRPDDKTTIVFMDPYHYFVNGIAHKCYFLLVMVLFIGLISSALWYLKKAGRTRRALTSTDIKDETEIEMTKTLIFVIFAFLISVIPSYTRHFFGRKVLCNYVNFFVTWLFLSSSTMNFLIYNVRNPAFRRKTCQMLQKGMMTITGRLHACRPNRVEHIKDPNTIKPRRCNSKSEECESRKLQKPNINSHYGSNKTQSSPSVSCKVNVNMQNRKIYTNFEPSSDHACNKKQSQTSVLSKKDNPKQDHVQPSSSTNIKYKQEDVDAYDLSQKETTQLDPKELPIRSILSEDVKMRLKEDKVEFTLHM
ncbi:unnamed protein product [Meganyctiphanes norvegica]|uniref:G-protein coupled receptors family 1 profile domain-containing protein n=1 Tax=Meganyctiphanes norvegica TaxID=48144 RepID=A0AAV2QF79_MEGNR